MIAFAKQVGSLSWIIHHNIMKSEFNLVILGYMGKRCSVEDPCVPDSLNRSRHDCLHGACVHPIISIKNDVEVADYECECDFGYGGDYCIHLVEKIRYIYI